MGDEKVPGQKAKDKLIVYSLLAVMLICSCQLLGIIDIFGYSVFSGFFSVISGNATFVGYGLPARRSAREVEKATQKEFGFSSTGVGCMVTRSFIFGINQHNAVVSVLLNFRNGFGWEDRYTKLLQARTTEWEYDHTDSSERARILKQMVEKYKDWHAHFPESIPAVIQDAQQNQYFISLKWRNLQDPSWYVDPEKKPRPNTLTYQLLKDLSKKQFGYQILPYNQSGENRFKYTNLVDMTVTSVPGHEKFVAFSENKMTYWDPLSRPGKTAELTFIKMPPIQKKLYESYRPIFPPQIISNNGRFVGYKGYGLYNHFLQKKLDEATHKVGNQGFVVHVDFNKNAEAFYVLDVLKGNVIHKSEHVSPLTEDFVAISPDGKLAVLSSSFEKRFVREINSWKTILEFETGVNGYSYKQPRINEDKKLQHEVFSADNSKVINCGANVSAYYLKKPNKLFELPVDCLGVASGQKTFVAETWKWHDDGTSHYKNRTDVYEDLNNITFFLDVFDLSEGRLLRQIDPENKIPITQFKMLKNEENLLAVYKKSDTLNTLKNWDLKTGKLLWQIDLDKPVTRLFIGQDEKTVLLAYNSLNPFELVRIDLQTGKFLPL